MHAAGDQASQDSAVDGRSPAAANEQPVTPNRAGARGYPRAASSSAASAAGGCTKGDDPEIEGLYSGESDSPSNLKSPAKSGRKAAGVETMAATTRGNLGPDLRHELFG